MSPVMAALVHGVAGHILDYEVMWHPAPHATSPMLHGTEPFQSRCRQSFTVNRHCYENDRRLVYPLAPPNFQHRTWPGKAIRNSRESGNPERLYSRESLDSKFRRNDGLTLKMPYARYSSSGRYDLKVVQ